MSQVSHTTDGSSSPNRHLEVGSPASQSLLGKESPVYTRPLWQIIHFLGFFVGGTTFIAGTACYFYPDWVDGGTYAGWLYVIGSCGFLSVDVLEFFTFTEDKLLRLNISLSAIGSTLYVVGSVGFLPNIYAETPLVGEWGFIMGSAFIGCSQMWKVHRIGSDNVEGKFRWVYLLFSKDAFTQFGVEASAGIGAWCFFVGTIMWVKGPLEGQWYQSILQIWETGSVFFTLGALFLGFRHGVMRV